MATGKVDAVPGRGCAGDRGFVAPEYRKQRSDNGVASIHGRLSPQTRMLSDSDSLDGLLDSFSQPIGALARSPGVAVAASVLDAAFSNAYYTSPPMVDKTVRSARSAPYDVQQSAHASYMSQLADPSQGVWEDRVPLPCIHGGPSPAPI
jgi:hypothetical protein